MYIYNKQHRNKPTIKHQMYVKRGGEKKKKERMVQRISYAGITANH